MSFDLTAAGEADPGNSILRFDCFNETAHYHIGPFGEYPVPSMKEEAIKDPVVGLLSA